MTFQWAPGHPLFWAYVYGLKYILAGIPQEGALLSHTE